MTETKLKVGWGAPAASVRVAVDEAVYVIDLELAKPRSERNVEAIEACRNILFALIGLKQLSYAKQYLKDTEQDAERI